MSHKIDHEYEKQPDKLMDDECIDLVFVACQPVIFIKLDPDRESHWTCTGLQSGDVTQKLIKTLWLKISTKDKNKVAR